MSQIVIQNEDIQKTYTDFYMASLKHNEERSTDMSVGFAKLEPDLLKTGEFFIMEDAYAIRLSYTEKRAFSVGGIKYTSDDVSQSLRLFIDAELFTLDDVRQKLDDEYLAKTMQEDGDDCVAKITAMRSDGQPIYKSFKENDIVITSVDGHWQAVKAHPKAEQSKPEFLL